MKTTRKYTMSAMNLIIEPSTVICAVFHGDKTYTGPIGELGPWAKQNDVGVLGSCHVDDERYGLFPCILATNARVASALSMLSGYEVAMGDGRSFFTRKDALNAYKLLKRAGVPVEPAALVWAITETPYAKPEPKPVTKQPSLAAQLADCPF